MTTGLSSNLSFIRRAFLPKRLVVAPAHLGTPRSSWRSAAIILVPYLWMILFFLVPFAIIFKISLSVTAIAIPPYSPLVTFEEGAMRIILHLEPTRTAPISAPTSSLCR